MTDAEGIVPPVPETSLRSFRWTDAWRRASVVLGIPLFFALLFALIVLFFAWEHFLADIMCGAVIQQADACFRETALLARFLYVLLGVGCLAVIATWGLRTAAGWRLRARRLQIRDRLQSSTSEVVGALERRFASPSSFEHRVWFASMLLAVDALLFIVATLVAVELRSQSETIGGGYAQLLFIALAATCLLSAWILSRRAFLFHRVARRLRDEFDMELGQHVPGAAQTTSNAKAPIAFRPWDGTGPTLQRPKT